VVLDELDRQDPALDSDEIDALLMAGGTDGKQGAVWYG